MRHIETMRDHERMPTRQLLQEISLAVAQGETDFFIAASGQHDIGGPLWGGHELTLTVTNPGQRVGAMCLPGTRVVVQGSAPADVGWLNSGGHIVVQGDCGDTAGHCAAAGTIYIGGRAGTRSGSLMKHDPLDTEPELWVLGSVGSFSFEFMAGGKAVVCGVGCNGPVLGERPCVGMVGGCVYVHGPVGQLTSDVQCLPLEAADKQWLEKGLPAFLGAVNREKALQGLLQWETWHKIVPAPHAGEDGASCLDMPAYRANSWVKGGIFSELYPDDFAVASLTGTGNDRLRLPVRNGESQCRDCHLCAKHCPQKAITRVENEKQADYVCDAQACIGCGICAAVCPANLWLLQANA